MAIACRYVADVPAQKPVLRGATFWMELHWKGERYRRSLETTDRETILIKLDDAVNAIRSGELPKTYEPITCQAMYEAWMLKAETECKPKTVRDYQQRYNKHLKPFFGNLWQLRSHWPQQAYAQGCWGLHSES